MLKQLPPQDHAISKTIADNLKRAYKAQVLGEHPVYAHHFHASQVKELLGKHDIKTFTVSMGYNTEKNEEVVILEGFDTEGKSLDVFLEMSMPCPPYCNTAEDVADEVDKADLPTSPGAQE